MVSPLDIERGLKQREFSLVYQPKVRVGLLQDDTQWSVEALCRWCTSSGEHIRPDIFIAIAEQNDLIGQVTQFVIDEALDQMEQWLKEDVQIKTAINLSPLVLQNDRLIEDLIERVERSPVSVGQIILELTESTDLALDTDSERQLDRLTEAGFTLSLDDFGTGYSSLVALYRMPFQELKLDRCFVQDITENAHASALVESNIRMAHQIGMQVCAEGVESDEILARLSDMGCDTAQGFFMCKPVPAADVPAFFRETWPQICRDTLNWQASRPVAIENHVDAEEDATIILAHPAETTEAPIKGDAALTIDGQHFCLLPRGLTTLGRQSSSLNPRIALGCRWLSRGDRQVQIGYENGTWWAADGNSTNGTWLRSERMTAGSRYPLKFTSDREVIDLPSQDAASRSSAICRMTLTQLEGIPDALQLTLSAPDYLGNEAFFKEYWPTIERDCSTIWLLFHNTLAIGSDPASAIYSKKFVHRHAGLLEYDDGYFVRANANDTPSDSDTLSADRQPITATGTFELAGVPLTFDHLTDEDASLNIDTHAIQSHSTQK